MVRKDKKIHQVVNNLFKPIPKFSTLFSNTFNFRSVTITILLLVNIFVLAKLNFFVPLISGRTTLWDFDDYFRLVGDLFKGINPYEVSYMRTWGPPLVFIYYIPFHFFRLETARSLTTLLNISSGVTTSILLSKNLFPKEKLLSFLILNFLYFSSFPTRFSLEMGQPNLFLGLAITGIIFSKRENIKAVLEALIISLKTFYLMTLIPSIIKKRRLVFKTILILLLAIIIFSPILHVDINTLYITKTLPQLFSGKSFAEGIDYYNQSVLSVLGRIGIKSATKGVYFIFVLLSSFAILMSQSFEIAVVLSVITSIISWQHYFAVLFPIYIIVLSKCTKKLLPIAFWCFLFFFWWVEFPCLHSAAENTANGILASHYFLSALFLCAFILKNKKTHLTNQALLK